MSIETLKEQARRHEQKEEWLKALDQYKKAINRLEAEDQPDIGLYNRVGDLYVRVGRLHEAVEHYRRAVDLYMESELPNNAIAVCKKIIRNVPDRHEAYLRMGQIRAQQGFLPDARTNFLTYAERMQQMGDLDESFRALVEFCDLAPDDYEVRVAVAEQMASHERVGDAVDQLAVAYHTLMGKGETMAAMDIETKIRELDPDADLSASMETSAAADDLVGAADMGEDAQILGSYDDLEVSGAFSVEEHEPAAEEELEIERHVLDMPTATEEEVGERLSDDDFASETAAEAMEEALEEAGADRGEDREEEAGEGDATGIEVGQPFGELTEAGEAVSEEEYAEEAYAEQQDDAFDLPLMEFDDDEIGEVVADQEEEETGEGEFDLPLMEFETDEGEVGVVAGDNDEAADEAVDEAEADDEDFDLPMIEFAEEEEEDAVTPPSEEVEQAMEEAAAELAEGEDEAVEEGAAQDEAVEDQATEEAPPTLASLRALIEDQPDDVNLRQRLVETAYRSGDEGALAEAYLGLGETLQRAGQEARARVAFQQCLQHDPSNEAAKASLGDTAASAEPVREVASHEEYVDLGALVLDEGGEKTTRFTVEYQEPSGDEQADFAKMLSQFKEKVSENLAADDVRAHHDLGTAYKEMGLLDEAVSEFQAALRASAVHLPTYELLGQTFMEMGRNDMAIRSLQRALAVDHEIEDELIGIYYYLARAYESEGQKNEALEFYDRVFSLDINFADVTERLRALR